MTNQFIERRFEEQAAEIEILSEEVDRLSSVAFLRGGCEFIRTKDVEAVVLEQRDKERALRIEAEQDSVRRTDLLNKALDERDELEAKITAVEKQVEWWASGPTANVDTMIRAVAAQIIQSILEDHCE